MVKLVHEYLSELNVAFASDDLAAADAIFLKRPDLRKRERTLGGSWLYHGAACWSVKVLEYLYRSGFDLDARAKQEGDNALCSAARAGRYDNAVYLIQHGIAIDTSLSVRNPLFAAIRTRSMVSTMHADEREYIPLVKLILSTGIDASIEYKSPTMNRLNAAGFALSEDNSETAQTIVSHQAQGNAAAYEKFMLAAVDAEKRVHLRSPYNEWTEHLPNVVP